MVKGISRQVIVVHSPDPKLFEQAIFILKENVTDQGITNEALLKEARKAIRTPEKEGRKWVLYRFGPVWACGGAMVTALVWLITSFL